MSGLSARTYSCGGEGSRLGRGGEASGESLRAMALFLSTLWKNLRIPCFSSNWTSDSSSEGGGERDEIDESSEESSSAMLSVVSSSNCVVCGCRMKSESKASVEAGRSDEMESSLLGGGRSPPLSNCHGTDFSGR